MAIAIFGLGAVGGQTSRRLGGTESVRSVDKRVTAADIGYELEPGDIAVLATPCGTHVDLARAAIERGAHVVSVSDSTEEVQALLEMDSDARGYSSTIIVGAGFAPGLSCVLARHGVNKLDNIDGISVSKHGTGGPACARQHHRAFKQSAYDWVDGEFITRPAGSGRELVWFPAPVGAKDCYRAALASPLLLRRMFPEAQRIASRVSGSRRDRMTARLPMLRRPHPDGGIGGIRVEVRGTKDGVYSTVVYGVAARPSAATSVVASVAANKIAAGECIPGARGLAEQGNPQPWLESFRAGGIKIETFSGV